MVSPDQIAFSLLKPEFLKFSKGIQEYYGPGAPAFSSLHVVKRGIEGVSS